MNDIQKTALRLPRKLHTQVVSAAKENDRTMNSEIVNRLEMSFASKEPQGSISDASQARELAQRSRENVVQSIRQLCYFEIERTARLGGQSTQIDLSKYELDSYTEDAWEETITPILKELKDKGFSIDDDVSADGFFIEF